MSDKLTATLSLIVTLAIAFFAAAWAIPMLVNKHEDWAMGVAGLLALGTIGVVWSAIEYVGPSLGLWDEKGPSDEK